MLRRNSFSCNITYTTLHSYIFCLGIFSYCWATMPQRFLCLSFGCLGALSISPAWRDAPPPPLLKSSSMWSMAWFFCMLIPHGWYATTYSAFVLLELGNLFSRAESSVSFHRGLNKRQKINFKRCSYFLTHQWWKQFNGIRTVRQQRHRRWTTFCLEWNSLYLEAYIKSPVSVTCPHSWLPPGLKLFVALVDKPEQRMAYACVKLFKFGMVKPRVLYNNILWFFCSLNSWASFR